MSKLKYRRFLGSGNTFVGYVRGWKVTCKDCATSKTHVFNNSKPMPPDFVWRKFEQDGFILGYNPGDDQCQGCFEEARKKLRERFSNAPPAEKPTSTVLRPVQTPESAKPAPSPAPRILPALSPRELAAAVFPTKAPEPPRVEEKPPLAVFGPAPSVSPDLDQLWDVAQSIFNQLSKQFDASLQKELAEFTGLEQGTGETSAAFARRVLAYIDAAEDAEFGLLSKKAQLWFNFCNLVTDTKLNLVPGSVEPLSRTMKMAMTAAPSAPKPEVPEAPPPFTVPEGVPYQRTWIRNITEKLYGSKTRDRSAFRGQRDPERSADDRAKAFVAARDVLGGGIRVVEAAKKHGVPGQNISRAVAVLQWAPELEGELLYLSYKEAVARKRAKEEINA